MIDKIDRKILNILQEDARTSNAAIGRAVGLSAAAIHARIRKLTETGVIRRFTVRIDPAAIDRTILAFVRVYMDEMRRFEETIQVLLQLDEVLEVHNTIGEACFLLKIRCASPSRLEDLLAMINEAPGVRSTLTTLSLRTARERINPPLDEDDGEGDGENKA